MNVDSRFSAENVRFWIRHRLPSKVALALGMIVPAVILYVSFWHRAPLIQEARERMVSASSLESELIGLKSGWSEAEAGRITDDYRATVASLVQDYDQLAAWLAGVGETARLSGFRMNYRLGDPAPLMELGENLSRTPIEITLETDVGRSGYLTMLPLLRHLVESRPGVSLTDATVEGDAARGATKIAFTLLLISTVTSVASTDGGGV